MKTLFLDIETAYIRGGAWRTWKTDFCVVEQEPYMLMIGYMWDTDKEATILSLPDHKGYYKKNPTSSAKILEKFYKELDKADIIVGHNLTQFDWPWIKGEAFMHGMNPPKEPMHNDTLTIAKQFKLRSRKLDYLLERLSLQGKVQHRGISLWKDCMDGDLDAWQEMAEYCKRDVEALPELYEEMRPWSKKNLQADATGHVCTKCGSSDLGLHSNKYTAGGVAYPYYRCYSCGGFSSGRTQVGKGVLKP